MVNMTSLRTLASTVAAAIAACAVTLAVTVPLNDGTEQQLLSGTIRWVNSTTWTVLNDTGHADTGLDYPQLMADRVRVHYDECAQTVGSLQVTPDESFQSAGVRVGASVGLCYADIYFYMGTSTTPVDPSLLSKSGANVWITGLMNPPLD